jgi:hypothetical protein
MSTTLRSRIRIAAAMGSAAAISISAAGAGAAGRRFQHHRSNKEEIKAVAVGWGAKKKILGKPVYNDKQEKIGVIDDLYIRCVHENSVTLRAVRRALALV